MKDSDPIETTDRGRPGWRSAALERWMRPEDHVREHGEQMIREPAGSLTHPCIVPSSPSSALCSTALCVWDSWLAGVALGQAESGAGTPARFRSSEEGSVPKSLDQLDEDGVIPIQQLVRRSSAAEPIRPQVGPLARFLVRYLESRVHEGIGLASWSSGGTSRRTDRRTSPTTPTAATRS